MTWFRVNVLVGQARQVLEIQAETAETSWLGALVFRSHDRTVAHFRAGQWGSYWEVGALRAEPLGDGEVAVAKDGERPLPRSRGPFEVRQKPVLP